MSGILFVAHNHKPRKLVSLVRNHGDNTFFAELDTKDEQIYAMLPDVSSHGFVVSHGSAIMLAGLINVHPHTDPSVGELKTNHSLFGLLSGGKNAEFLVRRVSGSAWDVVKMSPGDWVIFRDDVDHKVMAHTQWLGVAVQLAQVPFATQSFDNTVSE